MSTAYIAEREGNFTLAISATHEAMQALEGAHLQRSPQYTSVAHEYARSLAAAGRYHDAWTAEEAVMATVASVGRDNTSGYFAMLNVGVQALLNGGKPFFAVSCRTSAGVAASLLTSTRLSKRDSHSASLILGR